jgi:nitrogen-specific signal transduction histidine kinase/CheY-like chemotaxis protein
VGRRIVELQASLAARVKELEQALSGAQKMEAVGRLAGGVAHDFNNLLTVIISGSDFLLRGIQAPAQRNFVEMIKGAGERGAALTRQLLAFSRRQVLRPEVLRPAALLANLEMLLRRLIGEDIELVTDFAPDSGCVRADPGQLEQVVMNLAVNARDAMPTGGRLLLRTRNADLPDHPPSGLGVVPAGAYVVLTVTDTGCGMTDEVLGHLFEPFFTTKDLHKGTGLGLATVYGIVQQTGGHIRVESAPGRGSTFDVYLPRTEEPLLVPVEGERAAPAAPVADGNSETLLLVEDEDAVRAMAREALLLSGYRVLEARDGREALRLSAEWPHPIGLTVTDVVMPQMSGRDLAERLRLQRPAMKVLYVSGYTDDAVVCHGVPGPGRAFLQKPFTPSVLAAKVREVLEEESRA